MPQPKSRSARKEALLHPKDKSNLPLSTKPYKGLHAIAVNACGEQSPGHFSEQLAYMAYKRSQEGYSQERKLLESFMGEFPQQQWFERVREWGGVCLCCGCDVDLTVDHIVPVHLGGTNNIENLQLLCRSCNSSKGTKKDDYRPPR